jgi:hypothetical protein
MKGRPHAITLAAAIMAGLASGIGQTAQHLGLAPNQNIEAAYTRKRHRFLPGLAPPHRTPSGARNAKTRRKKHRCNKPVRRWKAHAK